MYYPPYGQPPFQYAAAPIPGNRWEARELRRKSSAVGYTMLVSFASMQVLSTILVLFIQKMGLIDLTKINNSFQGIDPIAYYLMYGIYAMASTVIPFAALLKISGVSFGEVLPFEHTGGITPACILMGMGGCMFANICTNILAANLESAGISPAAPPSPYENTLPSVLLYIVAFCAVPACVEEFAYRGVVLGLLRKFGDGFAIITSAILFGMMHGNLVQMPFAFIVGLILGYLVVRTGSLLPSILLHFFNNFYSCLLEILSYNMDTFAYTVFSYGSMILIFLLGFVALLFLLFKDLQFFSLPSSNSVLL